MPGIMDVAESEMQPGIEVVVGANELFAPVSRLCGKSNKTADTIAVHRSGRRKHRQQRSRKRVDGHLVAGEQASRARHTCGDHWAVGTWT